ncbi:MAG: Hsp33 family molecular chaperone HslO [Gammaproteobacteria bacterium]|nr:Hsp33 family molecular chaperone HslO [Gammaproteobacteria bacterium]
MHDGDKLHRFTLDGSAVRGELVQLDESWQGLLARADYPLNLKRLLGEALAATALMAATLKMSGGGLTLQVSGGDGPVSLLVIQAKADGGLRGMAKWRDEVPEASLDKLFGAQAQMVMTIDPGEGQEQYQGVVELQGQGLADALQTYFIRSEQLPTRFWLCADEEGVAGLLLQRLAGADAEDESWQRAVHLAATVKPVELLQLPAVEVLHRLFHEEEVRLFEPQAQRFACSCSQQRSENMLRSLGLNELRQLLLQEPEVAITCEFCSARYAFDVVDVEALFSDSHEGDLSHH